MRLCTAAGCNCDVHRVEFLLCPLVEERVHGITISTGTNGMVFSETMAPTAPRHLTRGGYIARGSTVPAAGCCLAGYMPTLCGRDCREGRACASTDGWNHPSFSEILSFGQCVVFRLHDVYSSVHPQTLHLFGVMEVALLLRSMPTSLHRCELELRKLACCLSHWRQTSQTLR